MTDLRIREVCKKQGISMQMLAKKLGITRQALYTSISNNPTLDRLNEIAGILNVDIRELLPPPACSEVNGYIKIKGIVHEINSFDDLERLSMMRDEVK